MTTDKARLYYVAEIDYTNRQYSSVLINLRNYCIFVRTAVLSIGFSKQFQKITHFKKQYDYKAKQNVTMVVSRCSVVYCNNKHQPFGEGVSRLFAHFSNTTWSSGPHI